MNYTSCIKPPTSKSDSSPEKMNQNNTANDQAIYSELISVANEVLGPGNWSHSVTSQTIDFVEYIMGKYHIGCAAFVRVQMSDGNFHEDMGYCNAENSTKGLAIQTARVVSITNGLRKALTCFGGEIESKILKSGKDKVKSFDLTGKLDNQKEIEKPTSSLSRSNSASWSNSSLKLEISEAPTKDVGMTSKEQKSSSSSIQVSKPIVNQIQKATSTNSVDEQNNLTNIGARSEEELQRLERKRRQKQKQEEFKRKMTEKDLKIVDKQTFKF